MVCCRCNKSGFCSGFACVKAKGTCDSCLPGKLGHCANNSTTNGNSTRGELPPCDLACDLRSAINPADVNANINDPQTVVGVNNVPPGDYSLVNIVPPDYR